MDPIVLQFPPIGLLSALQDRDSATLRLDTRDPLSRFDSGAGPIAMTNDKKKFCLARLTQFLFLSLCFEIDRASRLALVPRRERERETPKETRDEIVSGFAPDCGLA